MKPYPITGRPYHLENLTASFDSALSLLAQSYIRDFIHHKLRNAFDELLQDTTVTAWICSDPLTALAAYEFLYEKGVTIPSRLSLVCIDTNHLTAAYGITGYSLNRAGQGFTAAHYLMKDLPIRRNRRGMLVVPGEMNILSTAGPGPFYR